MKPRNLKQAMIAGGIIDINNIFVSHNFNKRTYYSIKVLFPFPVKVYKDGSCCLSAWYTYSADYIRRIL